MHVDSNGTGKVLAELNKNTQVNAKMLEELKSILYNLSIKEQSLFKLSKEYESQITEGNKVLVELKSLESSISEKYPLVDDQLDQSRSTADLINEKLTDLDEKLKSAQLIYSGLTELGAKYDSWSTEVTNRISHVNDKLASAETMLNESKLVSDDVKKVQSEVDYVYKKVKSIKKKLPKQIDEDAIYENIDKLSSQVTSLMANVASAKEESTEEHPIVDIEARESVMKLQDSMNAFASKSSLESLRNTFDQELSDKIDSIKNLCSSTFESTKDLEEKYEILSQISDQLRDKYNQYEGALKSYDSLDERVKSLSGDMKSLSDGLASMVGTISNMATVHGKDMDEIAKKTDEVSANADKSITVLKKSLSDEMQKANALAQSISSLQGDVNTIRELYKGDLMNNLTEIQSGAVIVANLRKLYTEYSSTSLDLIRSRIDELSTRLDSLPTAIDIVKSMSVYDLIKTAIKRLISKH